uniref:Major facilitator superfamily (MFS) profile domain-containing protein n=1 Tax=Noctiluca scintillans TaxID=2966 RepID=A0A7S1AU94_NOCSC
MFLNFGTFAATLWNYWVQDLPVGWVYGVYPIGFLGVLFGFAMLMCPDSPRHTLHRGRREKAFTDLVWLRQGAVVQSIEDEWSVMVLNLEAERLNGHVTHGLLSSFMGRLVAVGFCGWLLFQFGGNTAFTYYGPTMFHMAGMDAFEFQMLVSGVGFLVTLPSLWMVDHLGRKTLLLVGSFIMAVSMLTLGIYGGRAIVIPNVCPSSSDPSDCAHSRGRQAGEVAVVSQVIVVSMILLFTMAHTASWGVVMNTFTNEIYPVKFRAKAVAVGALGSCLGQLTMSLFTPKLLDTIHFWTFALFGVVDVVCVLYAIWIPETAGLHLEHTIEVFEKRLGKKYHTAHS